MQRVAQGTPHDQRRDSPMVELALLLAECMQHGLRTIAFCKTRKLSELVGAYTRETLKATAPHLAERLKVYRGGYAPADRRDIEQGLHSGRLLAVTATNALELGVDVGGLDATLHLGFQGSLASLRQQAGRAGRREQSSLAVYVAFDGPLDQYFMRNPHQLFDKPVEHAQIDPSNPHVLQQHVMCAAAELPVDPTPGGSDQHYFGPRLQEAVTALQGAGLLGRDARSHGPYAPVRYCGASDVPAADVSLRTIDDTHFDIVLEGGNQVLEQVEMSNVFYEVYDGAIYLFQGRPFLCKRLDLGSRTAVVRPVDVKYYTKVTDVTDIHVVGTTRAYAHPLPHQPAALAPPPTSRDDHLHDPPARARVAPPHAAAAMQQQPHGSSHAAAAVLPPGRSSTADVRAAGSMASDACACCAGQPAAAGPGSSSANGVQPAAHNCVHSAAVHTGHGAAAPAAQPRQSMPGAACPHCGSAAGPAAGAEAPAEVGPQGGSAAAGAAAGVWPLPTSAVCEDAVVTVRYLGFHRVWQGTNQVFDSVDLWLPDVRYETQAAHMRVPRTARQACAQAGLSFREGVHAAQHAVLNVLPLLVCCNPKDVGAECDNPYDTRYKPERLIIYDKHPGGIGLTAQAAPLFHELLWRALRLVEGCGCGEAKGCPGCVQHLDCGNYNTVLSKQAGLLVLRACLDAEQLHAGRVLGQAGAVK